MLYTWIEANIPCSEDDPTKVLYEMSTAYISEVFGCMGKYDVADIIEFW